MNETSTGGREGGLGTAVGKEQPLRVRGGENQERARHER